MELRKLEKTEEANYSEYIKSWKAEKIVPTSSDDKGKAFNNFLKKLKSDEIENNGRVPSETYFLFMKNGEIAGAINCRYALNEHLREIGGHIGYGVSPNYRNQGIATTMLRLVLDSYPTMRTKEVSKRFFHVVENFMKQEKKNRNLMENIGLNFNNLLSRKFIGEPLKKITEKFPYKETFCNLF